MNTPDEEKDKFKEPEMDYSKRVIITTLFDLEERDRELTRNMTHEERMIYLQKIISITYGADLSAYEKIFHESRIKIRTLE